MRWRKQDGLEWLEWTAEGARAAFSTRLGGSSAGPYESLNLGIRTGDEAASVRENRHRLAATLGLDPLSVAMARQVHGANLLVHDGPQDPSVFAQGAVAPVEADAHVTRRPGIALCVLVADCLPVALVGAEGIAMLHCGWRSLAAGIVRRGVEEVDARAAAVGPGIGRDRFEVGEEVLEAFEHLGTDVADGRLLDLQEVTVRLLREAGVTDIEAAGICTYEDRRFYSHRRDAGHTGRQAGLAWLEQPESKRHGEGGAH